MALPLFVDAGCGPKPFWEGTEAPLWDETLRLKGLVRPTFGRSEKQECLHTGRLENHAGTGFLATLLRAEDAILELTTAFLKRPHGAEGLATFQTEQAEQAMTVLKTAAPSG